MANPKESVKRKANNLDIAVTELAAGKVITTPLTNSLGCKVNGQDSRWTPPEATKLMQVY